MILAAMENLASVQCDITAAFVTAPIPKDEVVYVKQSKGFIKDSTKVLCLNSCLYGMQQSPRYSFGYLTKEAMLIMSSSKMSPVSENMSRHNVASHLRKSGLINVATKATKL